MSLFSTPSPPSEAGGTGPAGGKPDFPSPTKLERNGLTGAELGAQTLTSGKNQVSDPIKRLEEPSSSLTWCAVTTGLN